MHPRWISRLSAPLIAFVLTVAPSVSPVPAVEDARKVSVVSFGLFGDQGVFRSEATGAAQVVAGRFGSGPINVQYNSKKGGGATIEGMAMYLQSAAAMSRLAFLVRCSRRECELAHKSQTKRPARRRYLSSVTLPVHSLVDLCTVTPIIGRQRQHLFDRPHKKRVKLGNG
jgi:hypothetical protein